MNATALRQRVDFIKIISTTTAGLVFILAGLAFVLSYASLKHLAASAGVTGTFFGLFALAVLWPLLLDFAMIVFALSILRANLRGESALYSWGLTIGFGLLAIVANVLDVTTFGIPEYVIKAAVKGLAPVALLLSFELLTSMIRAEIKRANVVQSLAELTARLEQRAKEFDERLNRIKARFKAAIERERQQYQGEIERLTGQFDSRKKELEGELAILRDQLDGLNEQIKQRQMALSRLESRSTVQEAVQSDSDPIEQRRLRIVSILSTEEGIGPSAISSRLNVSRGTVYNDLAALEQAGQVMKNGDGYKVL